MKSKRVKMILPDEEDVMEFLRESNAIEGEYSLQALKDAEKAWKYAITVSTFTSKEILKVHNILSRKIMPKIAGKFRTCDVWIGGQHKRFIDSSLLKHQVDDALAEIVKSFTFKGDKSLIALDCHVMFEDVHPFVDGNGRTGRILYNWHRLQLGLPLHIIHEGREQMEYYEWFRKPRREEIDYE